MTSPNGIDWTKQNSTVSESLYGIAFGNGKFIAVGNSGRIISSLNGVDWVPQQVTSYELRGIAFGNDTFVAVGLGGTILTSDTGTSWNQTSIQAQYFFYGITYGNGIFIAAGENVSSREGIVTHYLGNGYVVQSSSSWFPLNGISFGNSVFLALGERGMVTRNPGVQPLGWESISNGTDRYLNAVSPFKNQLLAAGDRVIMDSRNGVTWRPHYGTTVNLTVNLWSVASGGDACVLVGDGGTIFTSTDNVWWVNPVSGTTDFLLAVTYGGNGKFVAVNTNGAVLTSLNGTSWSLKETWAMTGSTKDPLRSVVGGLNSFMTVGEGGIILESEKTGFPLFLPLISR